MSRETLGVVLAFTAFIAMLALYLIDKAGKNTPFITVAILLLMVVLSLWCIYLIPWLWHPKLAEKIWRVSLATAIILLLIGRFGIWVWPPHQNAEAGKSDATDYPHIQFKGSEQSTFRAAYAISATVACFRNDSVIGQTLPFEAQIIYRDAADKEVANVARGIWIPANSRHPYVTTFDTGVPRSLGILFMQEWVFYKPVADWVREHLVVSNTLFAHPKFEEFTGKIASIEIRLLSGTRQPKSFILDVSDYGKNKLPVLLLRRD
jgi:hypothetical protein